MTTLWQSVRAGNREKYLEDGEIPAAHEGRRGTWMLTARNVAILLAVVWFVGENFRWLDSSWRYVTVRHLANNDWSILAGLDPMNPYATGAFHWSVPAAWLWAGVVKIGYLGWTALHFAAVATIRDWRVVVLALVTYPFWADVVSGNMVTFAFVAAWHALAGNRWAVLAFCVLAAFIPRPIMLPVLAWLLWQRVDARWAFGAAALTVAVAGLATGTLGTFVGLLLSASGNELDKVWNVGPSSVIGAAWIPAGLVLGAWATWRGRLGLASLAVSPYLIHYYALFALLELPGRRLAGPKPSCSGQSQA